MTIRKEQIEQITEDYLNYLKLLILENLDNNLDFDKTDIRYINYKNEIISNIRMRTLHAKSMVRSRNTNEEYEKILDSNWEAFGKASKADKFKSWYRKEKIKCIL